MNFSLADAVGHVDPTVMQTLNVLNNDLANFIAGAGGAVFLVATGIALVRGRVVLPIWLGWVGVVLGVVSLVPFLAGPLAVGLWILVASVLILLRANRSVVATTQ